MSAADKLAQVLAEHGNWGWAADNDGPDTRIRCGCGADLGEVSDKNEEVQALEADALFAAHIAPVVLAHLTAEGWAQTVTEDWGVRLKLSPTRSTVQRHKTEESARAVVAESMRPDLLTLVRRRVTDWEPVETGDQE